MRHHYRTRALSLSALAILLGVSAAWSQATRTLHDTARNREERKEFKERREEWLNSMHRAEPDLDIRIVNRELRRAQRMVRDEKSVDLSGEDNMVRVTSSLVGYWYERGSRNQAGRTWSADLDTATNTLYVASDGGQIWRGSYTGSDWESLNDGHRFPNVKHLSVVRSIGTNTPRVLVVHDSYVRYSDNGGETWDTARGLSNIARWGGFSRAAVTDDDVPRVFAVGNEWDYGEAYRSFRVIYASRDAAGSFERLRHFEKSEQLIDVCSPAGADYALCIYGDTLAKLHRDLSIEVLVAEIEITGGMDGVSRLNLRSGDGETLYLHVRRGRVNELHASVDDGASWTLLSETTDLFSRNSFAVSPDDAGFVVLGGIETMVSRDYGLTWDTVNQWGEYYARPETRLHADIPWVGFVTAQDGSEHLLISTDGGIYRSTDQLKSVQNLSLSGLGVSQYYSVYTSRQDTSYIFAGSQDQGFQRSEPDRGGILDFEQSISGDYGHISSGDGGKRLWSDYPGFVMFYENAFRKPLGWGSRRDFPTDGHLWIPPIIADPVYPDVAWMGGAGADGGAHLIRYEHSAGTSIIEYEIQPFDFSRESGGKISAVAISKPDPSVRYVATNNGYFYRSTNSGKAWELVDDFIPPSGHHFYGTAVVPSRINPALVYVGGSGYSNPGVYVSYDYGQTFDSLSQGLPPTLVYGLSASSDDQYLFAATAVGPYMFIRDSARWYDIGQGIAPDQTWWSVDYIDETKVARFGTYGRGIWDYRIFESADTVTAVRSVATTSGDLSLSVRFSREGGFWNAVIELDRPAHVTLDLFDIEGRHVRSIVDDRVSGGTSAVPFQAVTDEGTRLPSGRYLLLMAADGTVRHQLITIP